VTTPTEGAAAIVNARGCPNEDGTQVLRLSARLKVVVRASNGSPIANIPAGDICVLFNGGTGPGLQGFTGAGGDSIIANFQFNQIANCPDVRCVSADAPTDANGTTYITWIGSTPGQPGVGTRDQFRKWGGYEGSIPVVVLGFQLQGRLTTASAPGTYTAHIKNLDHQGGRTAAANQGEVVNALDRNPVQNTVTIGTYVYNQDFDNNGDVNIIDLNFITGHFGHDCNSPNVN
jgi:hypothetical protein